MPKPLEILVGSSIYNVSIILNLKFKHTYSLIQNKFKHYDIFLTYDNKIKHHNIFLIYDKKKKIFKHILNLRQKTNLNMYILNL